MIIRQNFKFLSLLLLCLVSLLIMLTAMGLMTLQLLLPMTTSLMVDETFPETIVSADSTSDRRSTYLTFVPLVSHEASQDGIVVKSFVPTERETEWYVSPFARTVPIPIDQMVQIEVHPTPEIEVILNDDPARLNPPPQDEVKTSSDPVVFEPGIINEGQLYAQYRRLLKPKRENNPLVGVLAMPHIDVYRSVSEVPLTEAGWDISGLHDGVGLLEGGGQYPGDDLSMILVGHVTTAWPVPGPFHRLGHQNLGDEIRYQVGNELFIYKITRFLHANPSRADLLFREDGNQIILVTCSGYDLFNDVFDTRLVAYATLDRVEQLEMPVGMTQ